jgi:hypothetical protein
MIIENDSFSWHGSLWSSPWFVLLLIVTVSPMVCWSDRVDSMGQTKNTSLFGVCLWNPFLVKFSWHWECVVIGFIKLPKMEAICIYLSCCWPETVAYHHCWALKLGVVIVFCWKMPGYFPPCLSKTGFWHVDVHPKGWFIAMVATMHWIASVGEPIAYKQGN